MSQAWQMGIKQKMEGESIERNSLPADMSKHLSRMMEGESIEGNSLAVDMPELNKSTNAAQKAHSENNNKEVAKPELQSQEDLNVGQSQKAHSENKNKEVAKPELESQEDIFRYFGLANVHSYFEIKPYGELYPSDILYGNDSD